jgi:hypothetical protein
LSSSSFVRGTLLIAPGISIAFFSANSAHPAAVLL